MFGEKGTVQPFGWGIAMLLTVAGVLYVIGHADWAAYLAVPALWVSLMSVVSFLLMKGAAEANQEMRFMAWFLVGVFVEMAIGGGFMFYMIQVEQAPKWPVTITFFSAFFTFLYIKAVNLIYLINQSHGR
jgi:hypothetical protein